MSLSARRAWIEILIILYAFIGVLVALRKESVDRNYLVTEKDIPELESLSARRAWIEMVITAMTSQISVSLSARRAWIEILTDDVSTGGKIVALRKESVDRNKIPVPAWIYSNSRSPQGERG